MGRQSTIKTLPPDILEKLQALLLDPRMTQLQVTRQINAVLGKQDMEPISKSAVNRYAQTFEELTAEMVETERMSSLMVAEMSIGNDCDIGRVIAESLRVMMFHFVPLLRNAMKSDELDVKGMKDVVSMIATLTTGHERLEQSATINEKRSAEIERNAALKATKAAADQATATASAAGVSEETIRRIRMDVLGMAE